MILKGLETSAVSHALVPIPAVFPACLNMLWGEIEEIVSYLDIEELAIGLGSASRAGYLLISREKNSRKGEFGRRVARFCGRGDWLAAKIQSTNKDTNDISKRCRVQDKIILTSYPRSGNSYVRRILEK